MTFTKDGVTYMAERGRACAVDKNGRTLWRAIDVFTKGRPKRRDVLAFDRFVRCEDGRGKDE